MRPVDQAKLEYCYQALEQQHAPQRESLYEFLRYYWLKEKKEPLMENRHIKEICDKLEKVFRGEIKRLMINIPPRSLKTEIASIAFPAWCLGHRSETQIMEISYASGLAERNSSLCRAAYTSKTFKMCFPKSAPITKDQDTKQYRKTEDGGHYYAAGSSGTITGIGCDIMVIDDPLKPEDANSETVRPSVNNNYHDTLKSRLNSKKDGAIVIIMQRLHDDDLCGHLIEKELKGTGEKWEKLIIPAIAEEKDQYRDTGESFFEERFPLDILLQEKKSKPITFSCQYQQNPVNKDTQEFHEERFRYYGPGTPLERPAGLRIFTTCDPAFKQKQENDNSCIMTAGFKGDKMYILEYTVGKFTADVLLDKLVYHITKRRPEKTGIEAFQAQSMIVTFLKKKMQELGVHTLIEEIKQSGDKLTKIRRLVPLYRDGLVYHTVNMLDLENELKRFPRGKHDDIIDAEQMLYDLYALQPNSITNNFNINIERDEYGRPLQPSFYKDDRLAGAN